MVLIGVSRIAKRPKRAEQQFSIRSINFFLHMVVGLLVIMLDVAQSMFQVSKSSNRCYTKLIA